MPRLRLLAVPANEYWFSRMQHQAWLSQVQVATIFGKAWDFHVLKPWKPPWRRIWPWFDTPKILKESRLEVIFDAEHFFDGYKNNPEYAREVCLAAQEAGADWVVLCDTNGGCMTWEIEEIVGQIRKCLSVPLGIHVHDAGTGGSHPWPP